MTNTELLIEAVEYAIENGCDWWDVFNSITDAATVLRKAKRENPEEHQIAYILSLIEDDDIFLITPQQAFKECLSKLGKELKSIE